MSRDEFRDIAVSIASPVLREAAQDRLRQTLPHKDPPATGPGNSRKRKSHFTAFVRTILGLAYWFELDDPVGEDAEIRDELLADALAGLNNMMNPESNDYEDFGSAVFFLPEVAHLAQALLRAPESLWEPLPPETKKQVIQQLKNSRSIKPYQNNWLLFSAMVEIAILRFEGPEDYDRVPVDFALSKFEEWYLGDGHYGDGKEFHWDYYNSYTIHPFLLEIYDHLISSGELEEGYNRDVVIRAQRYADVLCRLVSPEGSYPPIGRSLAYRFGNLHLLSLMAYRNQLPSTLSKPQVRLAISAVIRRQTMNNKHLDAQGWLRVGVIGEQMGLAEVYMEIGATYLCMTVFAVLGLPEDDPFWHPSESAWPTREIWEGKDSHQDLYLGRTY